MLLRLIDGLGDAIDPEAVVMNEGSFARRLEAAGVPTRVVDLPGKLAVTRFPSVARRLVPELERGGFTFIHANGTKAAILGVRLARRLGIPIAWMKHDYGFEGPLTRYLAVRCDRIICVSQAMADPLGPQASNRVVVAYPGVELDPSPPTGESLPMIISVGPSRSPQGLHGPHRSRVDTACGRPRRFWLVIGGPDYPHAPGHGEALRAHAAALGMAEFTPDRLDRRYRRRVPPRRAWSR